MTPRVDSGSFGRHESNGSGTRAPAQAPSPRACPGGKDSGPGDHLIRGRYVAPRSRQPRLTPACLSRQATGPSFETSQPARLSRRATGPLFGEVQTLGCPPKVTAIRSGGLLDRWTPASLWFSSCRPPETGTNGRGLRPNATGSGPPHSGPRIQPRLLPRHC
jgi:hypothetical protein